MTNRWLVAWLALCLASAGAVGETGSPPVPDDIRRTADELLASACGEFDCTCVDVVVADASFGRDTNYIVRFSCEGKRCDDALQQLVARSADTDLSFSLRPPPLELEDDPFDAGEPGTFDLIHEIDPDPGQ